MYVVKYGDKNDPNAQAFFKPYTACRNTEIASQIYLTPSILDGICVENGLKGSIVRNKMSYVFNTGRKMLVSASNLFEGYIVEKKNGNEISKMTPDKQPTPCIIHTLGCVEIYLGFENEEDAITMSERTIYGGRSEFVLFPEYIGDVDDEWFDSLKGAELVKGNEFMGRNRHRNGERQYGDVVITY